MTNFVRSQAYLIPSAAAHRAAADILRKDPSDVEDRNRQPAGRAA